MNSTTRDTRLRAETSHGNVEISCVHFGVQARLRAETEVDPTPACRHEPLGGRAETPSPCLPVSKSPLLLIILCLSVSCGLILIGCNRGLSPLQTSTGVQPGFGGMIHFVSAWPPADTVQDLRVVAFKNYPPTNIINEVSSGQAKVFPPIGTTGLPKFVDSLSYNFLLDSAATFQYVVVAMQYGPNVLQDWEVVGAYGYSHGTGSAETVVVPPNSFVNGINIDVDFENKPPNPLGGVASPSPRH